MTSMAEPRASGSGGPRVSVVVPAYNRERYLGLTIESVLAQTVSDWELVVFDDGSTDGTLDVAKAYADKDRRIRVGQGPNGGVATARNRGFALTDPASEFVIFLDSDDLWESDALERLLGMLDEHPEYVGSHCLARCIDDDGRPIAGDDLEQRSRDRHGFRGGHLVAVAPDQPTTFADLVYHTWIVTPGTQLIRREVLTRVGGFDPATDPADDADLVIRLSRHGDVGFVDRALLRWRRHPDTLTNTSPRWGVATLRVRAKTLTDLSNTPEQTLATRQAYLHAVGSMVRAARDGLNGHDYREAMYQSLKAVNLYQAYVRAKARRLARRILSTTVTDRKGDRSARATRC